MVHRHWQVITHGCLNATAIGRFGKYLVGDSGHELYSVLSSLACGGHIVNFPINIERSQFGPGLPHPLMVFHWGATAFVFLMQKLQNATWLTFAPVFHLLVEIHSSHGATTKKTLKSLMTFCIPPLGQCAHIEWQVLCKKPTMTRWLSVLLLNSFFPKPVQACRSSNQQPSVSLGMASRDWPNSCPKNPGCSYKSIKMAASLGK